jgi:hypothetical protein
MWNYGARFISPMAWLGSSGRLAGQPGYDPFTAWPDTPLEEAARDFLIARSHLSPGSKLWTFGAGAHADDDHWTAMRGTRTASEPGVLSLAADAQGLLELVSPAELMLQPDRRYKLVLLCDGACPRVRGFYGQNSANAPWRKIELAPLGFRVPEGGLGQVRIELDSMPTATVRLLRVALIPAR